ncbi:hypothetical protein Tco_0038400 [Tanacetum coccineum]
MAPMALSDSEVTTCSKSCLKNYETLKKQYDDLRIELNQSEFNLANYKRGLAYVEERLVFYKKNEGMLYDKIAVLKRDASFNESEINALKIQIERLKKEKESNQFKINNFENASKSLDKLIGSQISDNNRKGVGYNAGGQKPSSWTSFAKKGDPSKFSQKLLTPSKKATLVQEKILTRSGPPNPLTPLHTPMPLDKVILMLLGRIGLMQLRPQHVGFGDQVNAVKASACWVWRPVKPNSASITLKKYDYGNPETKLEDLVRLNSPKDEKRAGAELTQQNDKSQYKK